MGLGDIAIFLGMTVPFFLMTIWALVDVTMKRFPSGGEKAAWWIIALVPFVGCLIYLVFGFRRGKKPEDGTFIL